MVDNIINPALIGNWQNWARVLLMVALGAVVINYTGRLIKQKKEA